MAVRSLLKFGIKYGTAGGVVYYAYDLGLWKDSDETIKNYAQFKRDVNTFLESSPALVEYLKGAGESARNAVKPVSESVSNFRKERLNFEIVYPNDGVLKSGWNKAVTFAAEGIASAPGSITQLTVTGLEKVSELVTTETPSGNSASEGSKNSA